MTLISRLVLFMALFLSACYSQKSITSRSQEEQKEKIFLLHGLGRSNSAMWSLASSLEDSGYIVQRVGYKSFGYSAEEILKTVTAQINANLPENNLPLHFVGHSMGGLMIRAYLDSIKVKNLGRVVLIGTPNKGTPIVDKYRDSWWMKMAGSMTLALGTDSSSFPKSLPEPYYPVGVIAGVSDGIGNESIIPGEDDGVVPLESTKLKGMTDMIVIKTSHTGMRYNDDVANQTVAFLRTGRFNNKDKNESHNLDKGE